jgi:hypothetical protein
VTGWIKLHRDMEHSGVWKDAKAYRVFSWLLWHANFKERTLLNGLTLKAGQLCTSRERIAAGCMMPKSTINLVLRRLANGNCIVMKPNSRGTLIEVVNWGKYQHDEDTSGQQTVRPLSADCPPAVPEEEGKKVRTLFNSPQSDGLQTVNGSKGRVEYSEEFKKFWQAFPSGRKTKKRKAFADFKKAKKRVDVATLMTAVEEYARSNKGRGKYCQMPSSWLNGDCWDDDRASWNEGTPIPTPKRKKTQAEIEAQIRSRELWSQLDKLKSQGQGMSDEAEAIKQQMEAIEI